MYRCRECNSTTEAPALVYDEYDNEIYRRCWQCGGITEKSEVGCMNCGRALYSGEKAIEIGGNIYCTDCPAEVMI